MADNKLKKILKELGPERAEEFVNKLRNLSEEDMTATLNDIDSMSEVEIRERVHASLGIDALTAQVPAVADVTKIAGLPPAGNADFTRDAGDILGGDPELSPLAMNPLTFPLSLVGLNPDVALLRASLSATPDLAGKLEILHNFNLKPTVDDAGTLMVQDPDNPDIAIPIDNNDKTMGDLASFGPDVLATALEIWQDHKMSQGGSPSRIGMAARIGKAGLVGMGAGALLDAVSVAGGGQRHLSVRQKTMALLDRMLGEGTANALGFAGGEVAGRTIRKATENVFHRQKDILPSDINRTEIGKEMESLGLPGSNIMRGQAGPMNTLVKMASASQRMDIQRVELQRSFDEAFEGLWKPLQRSADDEKLLKIQSQVVDIDKQLSLIGPEGTVVVSPSQVLGRPLETALSRMEAGEITQKNLDRYTKEMRKVHKVVFEDIGKQMDGARKRMVPKAMTELSKAMKVLLHDTSGIESYLRNTVKPKLTAKKVPIGTTDLRRTINNLGGQKSDFVIPQDPTARLDYNTMKQIATDLGDKIQWNQVYKGQEDAMAARVYKALRQDMFDFARSHRPELEETIRQANEKFSESMDFFRSPINRNVKRSKEASRILPSIFRSPENVKAMQRVTPKTEEQQQIGAAYLREIFGIADHDPFGIIVPSKVRNRIAKLKKEETWGAVFNDTDGIWDSGMGRKIEALVEAVDVDQTIMASRRKLAKKMVEGGFSSARPGELGFTQGMIRQFEKAVRNNADVLSANELQQVRLLLDDMRHAERTTFLRDKFEKDLLLARDKGITTKVAVNPSAYLEAIQSFLEDLTKEERRALEIGVDGNMPLQQIYAQFLGPAELEAMERISPIAQGIDIIDEIKGVAEPARQAFQTAKKSEVQLPPTIFQRQKIEASLFRRIMAIPAARILAPETFKTLPRKGGKTTAPFISDFLNRAIKGSATNPHQRQLEFAIQQMLRGTDMTIEGATGFSPLESPAGLIRPGQL